MKEGDKILKLAWGQYTTEVCLERSAAGWSRCGMTQERARHILPFIAAIAEGQRVEARATGMVAAYHLASTGRNIGEWHVPAKYEWENPYWEFRIA
jgi:hypothetical protein